MNKPQIESYINRGKRLTDTDWILVPAAIGLGVSIFNIYYCHMDAFVILLSAIINSITFATYFIVKPRAQKNNRLIPLFSGVFILILALDIFLSFYYSLHIHKGRIIALLLFTSVLCAGAEILCIRRSIQTGKYLLKENKRGACATSIPSAAVGVWMFVQYWLKRKQDVNLLQALYSLIFCFSIIICVYLGTFLLVQYYYIKKIEE